ncbi:fatty acid desaturase [Mycobacterium sp. URHB0044]|jgi:fatty acid desaturase|uniref:fatty acid desaturase n=1 Tax=Mycobacterium sp. URHB0044 TaxID=1380386 RepID=UPI000491EDC4|nr:fatty acid desaturase [Mycobacterium sp. URHB0044]
MNSDRLAAYDLIGPEGERAQRVGIAGGTWFRSSIPRKRLKELMRRDDRHATKNTAVWLGSLALTGAAGALAWTSGYTLLAIPAFAAYGLLYGTASDSRWHEAGHGTFFATRWKNEALYQISSFMRMLSPTKERWSHTRHHTDTLVVGRDPEIDVMRPARLARILANTIRLIDVPQSLAAMTLHSFGRLTDEEKTYIPEQEQPKVVRTARIHLSIFVATAAACVATGSIVPALLIGLPTAYGAPMLTVFSLTQHAGLGENVLDHRLNTRTVYMCRFNRFLYCNMNFHIEHHMFPMVPSHRLAELHEEVKQDCPPPYRSLWAAYREIIPAIARQLKDQTYYIRRELPEGAAPYHIPVPAADGRAISVGRDGAQITVA